MRYDYKCPDCGFIDEYIHSMKENPIISCPNCKILGKEVKMEHLITASSAGFIFKQWTESQCYKIGRDKNKQNKELELRQIERYGTGPQLKPNVAGVETESWSDAKKLAGEAGLNTSSFDSHVVKESSTSKVSGINDTKWKAAKEAAA